MARGEGWRRALFVFALLLFAPPRAAVAEAPPVEAFANLPAFRMPALSPDGTRYAAIEPEGGRPSLVLHSLDGAAAPYRLARSDGERIDWFAWAGDGRLIYSVSFAGRRGATRTTETRLYAVAAEGGRASVLPKEDVWTPAQVGTDLIGLSARDPDHILVNRDAKGQFSAFRIDVRDGSQERLETGTADTASWLADAAGAVRLRIDIVGMQKAIYGRIRADEPFRLLLRYEIGKDPSFFPLAFDPADPGILYAASDRDTGRQAIYRYDMARGSFGAPLFTHARFDLEDLVTAPDGRLLGYNFRDDLPKTVYVEAKAAERQRRIDAALPDTENPVVSQSADGRRALVIANGPREPGALYLFEDGRAAPRLLGRNYPALDRTQLAPVRSFSYRARDGIEIQSYVTQPRAMQGVPPLVLFVHGGPVSRDDMSFDMVSQFLASRGYAVMQPNFRGSSGYGRAFEDLAAGTWGRAMIDDLADGAKAAVAQGLAGAGRICVAGASYGGYAALMSAIRDPDLYRCVASISGPADLGAFVHEIERFRFAAVRARTLRASAPDGDFSAISPLPQAARIHLPVLLVHGEDDRVVLADHSRLMARALRHEGVRPELVMVAGGDHNFGDERQRRILLESLERFLAHALQGGS